MTKLKAIFHHFSLILKPLKHSSAAIMAHSYFFLLVITTLAMGISVPLVLGYQLIVNQDQNANQYLASLQKTNIDSAHDWQVWSKNNVFDNEVIFIKARTHKGHVFYSENASRVANQKHRPLLFSNNYLLDTKSWFNFDSYHLYYTKTVSQYGNHFTVWINLYKVVDIIKITLYTMLTVICLTLIFGIWRVWQLSQRLVAPLADLSSATEKVSLKIEQSNQGIKDRLPEPTTPIEVNELAKSFNQLLDVIGEKEDREKQFVSDASHELKTPIAAINGHLKLIKRRGQAHPEIIADSLAYISQETQRMQRLVQNLLDLSHAERDEIKITQVNLSSMLSEIAANMAFPQEIKMTTPGIFIVSADFDQLREIILALIENASKYSSEDKKILLSLKKSTKNTILEIKDFGIGIPKDAQKHIFERFYRVDESRSSKIPGSGLGLSIVKELADHQHIQIKVFENHPQGSIFQLIFPNEP